MKIKITELEGKVSRGVNKLGYEGEDADIIKDVLLYAQLRGNNQGITKIATGGVPEAKEIEVLKIEEKNKCVGLVSGGHSMVASVKAAELSCKLANEHGVGIVGVNHTFTSSGAIGYFSKIIADAGYIGFVCVGSPPFVTPFGSNEAKFGTNPISYAFPTKEGSVVYDAATAAMAYFGVVEAKLNNEKLPDGIAFDKDGNPTNDAEEALDGSVTAFGGQKGSGLALLVQLLSGPFVGAAYIGINKDEGSGTFVMAIDPSLLVSKEEYLENATNLINQISSANPIDGVDKVLLPGERGDNMTEEVKKTGEIEIADAVWQELCNFVDN